MPKIDQMGIGLSRRNPARSSHFMIRFKAVRKAMAISELADMNDEGLGSPEVGDLGAEARVEQDAAQLDVPDA